MPTLAPDNTPADIAYASRQGQSAPVSPALAHQLSLSELLTEFSALKTRLAAQDAEITNLKSQLAAREAGTAVPESAIPQSEISNLKSAIPDSHTSHSSHSSQIPHSKGEDPVDLRDRIPNSDNPAFAPLYAREVKHYLPGGDWIMPPVSSAALTRQAHIQRLNYLSTRCELALIERVDRFAVCGIVGPPEGEIFAFIMHHLSRLTSIYKSITALENDPTIPVGPVAKDLTNLATSIMRDPAASSGVPPSGGISSPSTNSQPDLAQPALASDRSDQSVGSSLPQSENPNLQSSICNLQSAVPTAPAIQSTPDVPVIREVPQCPTFSPERLVRTLDQTATALDISSAGILPAHSSTVANSQTPSPTLGARTPSSAIATAHQSPSASAENATTLGPRTSSSATPATSANAPSSTPEIGPLPLTPSHSSHTSHPSHSSHNPQSPDPSCPRATAPADPNSPAAPRPQCTECDAELCPSRIAVPIFTGILKRTQKCDGACRFCSTKRQHTCPYTLPRFRASPKV